MNKDSEVTDTGVSGEWYNNKGSCTDVVLSTRVRLARNLADFPFPHKFRADDSGRVQTLVFDAFAKGKGADCYQTIAVPSLQFLGARMLLERGLVKNSTLKSPGAGVIMRIKGKKANSGLVCTVNDTDHVRVSCFVYIAPYFGMNDTPARIRIGISFFTSILLYETLTPADAVVFDTVMEYAVIVMKEAIAGLLIGFGANSCMAIVNFAGSIADMETGLSMATLMDPATRESTSITGVLYQYSFMLMLIASGMYRYLFGALADSFTLIPINGVTFHADSLLNSMIEFMNDYILIGFRIVLPIFCVTLLLNAILGVLAKVSPQMNMFAVGIQLKVLAGLSALFLTAGMLPGAADFVYQEMKKMVVSFIGGMM